MLHMAHVISTHQTDSLGSTATRRLQPDDRTKNKIEEILRPEMPYVSVPPLKDLHCRSFPQYFLNLYKVWEIFLFVYSLQRTKNAISILTHLPLDL